jgi:hypothetical protein
MTHDIFRQVAAVAENYAIQGLKIPCLNVNR